MRFALFGSRFRVVWEESSAMGRDIRWGCVCSLPYLLDISLHIDSEETMKRNTETLYASDTWYRFEWMIKRAIILDISTWVFLAFGIVCIPLSVYTTTEAMKPIWMIGSLLCFGISIVSIAIEHRKDPDPELVPSEGQLPQRSSWHSFLQYICDAWHTYSWQLKIAGIFILLLIMGGVVVSVFAVSLLILVVQVFHLH